jgi:hypothetical protein
MRLGTLVLVAPEASETDVHGRMSVGCTNTACTNRGGCCVEYAPEALRQRSVSHYWQGMLDTSRDSGPLRLLLRIVLRLGGPEAKPSRRRIRVGPGIFGIRDQPIDRPPLDLVRRPRSLIFGLDSRAGARAPRDGGSVGATCALANLFIVRRHLLRCQGA